MTNKEHFSRELPYGLKACICSGYITHHRNLPKRGRIPCAATNVARLGYSHQLCVDHTNVKVTFMAFLCIQPSICTCARRTDTIMKTIHSFKYPRIIREVSSRNCHANSHCIVPCSRALSSENSNNLFRMPDAQTRKENFLRFFPQWAHLR